MASEDMNEVVTRGILKEELKEELKTEFDKFRIEMRAEMDHIAKFILERMEELLGLREEPVKDLPARVTALEAADLPARVTRLEAKVFPPKRPARRRG